MGFLFALAHSAARSHKRIGAVYQQIKVVVPSRDALLARRALLACPGAAIARCLPMHQDARVQLEIRFPAGQGGAVMQRMLACLPQGEFGGICAPSAAPPARAL
ncbi:hypothetical protein [Rhodoferax sp.]|uniref:hypothetical protein n=1 Tax=Rhodoferax sp. TaxID=50421 RepID=UPI00374D6AF1